MNDIKADLHDPDAAFVVVDHHKDGDFAPYVLRTTDRGRSWRSVAGDLPERHVAWRIVQDHVKPGLLFLGTEFGVFFTADGGKRWVKLKSGAPTIPFRDLAIQRRENDLVGATFGRGFYVLDDYSPLREVTEGLPTEEAALFPVRDAWWYIPSSPLGGGEKAEQGASFFTAPNPPFGAVFTYYLRDELKTLREARREREKEREKKGEDTPTPGWDELRREGDEEKPSIVLTVYDASGAVVRRISGPAEAGFHRVAWDLRYPSPQSWQEDKNDEWEEYTRGLLAPPGTYRVSLAKRMAGQLTVLAAEQTFQVKPLHPGEQPGVSPEILAAWTAEVDRMRRDVSAAGSTITETERRLRAIREVLLDWTGSTELGDRIRDLESEVAEMKRRLHGETRRRRAGDPGPVSISRRLSVAVDGTLFSTYGPTPTLRASLDIARRDLDALATELGQLLEVVLPALETDLDAAGVPWSPGRGASAGP